MSNIPSNVGPELDRAFGQALATAGGWAGSGGNLGFSLTSLLNSIENTGVFNVTQNPSVVQTTATLPVGIQGAASSTGGIGTVLDNSITQSSGEIVSFRTGGTEQANIDYSGNLNLLTQSTTPVLIGKISGIGGNGGIWTTTSPSITNYTLISNGSTATQLNVPTGGSIYLNVNNTAAATLTSTQLTVPPNLEVGGTNVNSTILFAAGSGSIEWNTGFGFVISGGPIQVPELETVAYIQSGTFTQPGTHFLAGGSVPTAASFHANFGTVTGVAVAGGDPAGIISFTTGTATSIGANSALCTVTLANAYSSVAFAIMVSNATATGALDTSAYYAVPNAAGSFIIYNNSAITPGSKTAYKLQFMTMGAGATS
jgi:hypothetical protein